MKIEIIKIMKSRFVDANKVIISQGDTGDVIVFLINGKAVISRKSYATPESSAKKNNFPSFEFRIKKTARKLKEAKKIKSQKSSQKSSEKEKETNLIGHQKSLSFESVEGTSTEMRPQSNSVNNRKKITSVIDYYENNEEIEKAKEKSVALEKLRDELREKVIQKIVGNDIWKNGSRSSWCGPVVQER